MWLTAAPGGVIGGDAVGVAVIWMWFRPPCECERSSFPSASASTRRRRLMPLGWRVARNDYLGSQIIPPTNSNRAVSKIISISTYLCALSSLTFAVYFFEIWRFFFHFGRETRFQTTRPHRCRWFQTALLNGVKAILSTAVAGALSIPRQDVGCKSIFTVATPLLLAA